jgi:hypothetical protein
LFGDSLEHVGIKSGFSLHRHAVKDCHQECREDIRFGRLR